MTDNDRLRDLRLFGLGTDADDTEVLEAYQRRRTLYEGEDLATYSLYDEGARKRMLADFEAALNRLVVAPQLPKPIKKSSTVIPEAEPPKAVLPLAPAGPEPDRDSSPGAFLRYRRIVRGISLAEVSLETKIAESTLEAIESEISMGLAVVYVRGFVANLAKLLGVSDPDALARAYLEKMRNVSGPESRD